MKKITNLARCRLDREYTQEQLAEISGVSKISIQKYEQRIRRVDDADLQTAIKLSVALGVPIYLLVEDPQTMMAMKWAEAQTRRKISDTN